MLHAPNILTIAIPFSLDNTQKIKTVTIKQSCPTTYDNYWMQIL